MSNKLADNSQTSLNKAAHLLGINELNKFDYKSLNSIRKLAKTFGCNEVELMKTFNNSNSVSIGDHTDNNAANKLLKNHSAKSSLDKSSKQPQSKNSLDILKITDTFIKANSKLSAVNGGRGNVEVAVSKPSEPMLKKVTKHSLAKKGSFSNNKKKPVTNSRPSATLLEGSTRLNKQQKPQPKILPNKLYNIASKKLMSTPIKVKINGSNQAHGYVDSPTKSIVYNTLSSVGDSVKQQQQVSLNQLVSNLNQRREVMLYKDEKLGFGFIAGSEKPLVIRFVTPEGPGKNKLLNGDEILCINDEDVQFASRDYVINLIRNSRNTIKMSVKQPTVRLISHLLFFIFFILHALNP